MRCEPDQEAADDGHGYIFYILGISNCSLTPCHSAPKIIVCGKEERPDENGLYYEKPCKYSAHKGNSHLLAVCIHPLGQPVSGKGEREKPGYGNNVCGIPHPVIMGPVFLCSGAKELVRNISVVPTRLSISPMVRCTHFLNPS